MAECYWQKFAPRAAEVQCKALGEFYRKACGNRTDDWTWCKDHVGPNRDDSRTPRTSSGEQT